jgi:polyisoprenoid-binding protein YceI
MRFKRYHKLLLGALSGAIALVLIACSSASQAPTVEPEPTPTGAPASQSTPVTTAQPTTAAKDVVLQIASGTQAGYRVREQLASVSFPSDAVGSTNSVTGSIVVRMDGSVDPKQSKITVDLRTLKSDENRRDMYIQDSTLQTRRYPNAEFVVNEITGIPWPPSNSTEGPVRISGDLTIHGVTKEAVWEGTAKIEGGQVTGLVTTSFKFGDFGMSRPNSFLVLSVEDNVRLELDFRFQMA